MRKKNFILGTSISYLYNFVSIIVGIIAVPISLKYFGSEKYGVIAIINTLITYLSITNFGIPYAVGILAAQALGALERMKIIAKAFITIIVIVIASLGIFLFFSSNPSWIRVLGNIPKNIYTEVSAAAFFAAILFLLKLPFSLFSHGFIAIHKVYIAKIYDILLVIFPFIGMLITIFLKENLVFYFVTSGILIGFISIAGFIHFLFFERENRVLLINHFNKLIQPPTMNEFSAKSIFVTGFRLFIIGMAATVVWHTDNLVISHFIGLDAVTPYSITFRLITVTFVIFTTLNTALNPMYGNAYASRDYQWINETYNKITIISQILGGMVWIGSIAFAEDIINLWVGPKGYGGMLMVFAIGGYGYTVSLNHVHSGLINSTNLIKNVAYIGWSEAMVNLFLSLLLVKYLGAGGVALGTFLAAVGTVFWMLPLELFKRSDGEIRFKYMQALNQFFIVILPFLICALITSFVIVNKDIRLTANLLLISLYIMVSYNKIPQDLKNSILELFRKNIVN